MLVIEFRLRIKFWIKFWIWLKFGVRIRFRHTCEGMFIRVI